MKYVLAMGLGPVQEFIASARRTRDLWYGSYLLSQASAAAALCLHEGGAELIFPTPATLQASEADRGNVSNKLLVVLTGTPDEVRQQAEAAAQAARERVEALARDPLEVIGASDAATAQLRDLLEVYWAVAPWAESTPYVEARRQAEAALTARKNTRNFHPVSWGGPQPKSSLDGQRESVTGPLSGRVRAQHGMREGEELCAPGLVKRLGLRGEREEARFMSTSHVAAQPYLVRLERRDPGRVSRDWQTYLGVLTAHDFGQEKIRREVPGAAVLQGRDGRLLYATRLAEDARDGDVLPAQRALGDFLRQHPARSAVFGPLAPDPYYAVLQADGDSMGQLISHEAQGGAARHSALSDALSRFAGRAGQLITEARGSLIYAGGDDVLALVPLHTALQVSGALNAAYTEAIGAYGEAGTRSTLSAGLVVAHFLTPLQDTLEAVRQAEKAAKKLPGKDALALEVRRRSGSPIRVRGHWTALLPLVEQLTGLYLEGALPHKFAYDVRRLAGELGAQAPAPLAQMELARILDRKRAEHGGRPVTDDVIQQLLTFAAQLDTSTPEDRAQRRPHEGLRALSDGLILAHVFARAQAQAGEEDHEHVPA